MGLIEFVLRRLLVSIVFLFVIATIVFFSTQGLPGDTARAILGQNASPEQVLALQQRLGLDKSVFEQYWHWLSNLMHLELGTSYTNGLPISGLLGEKFLASVAVAAAGGALGLALAISVALYSAIHRGSLLDQAAQKFGVLISAIPDFVLAILLILLFATSGFRILPATALIDPEETLLSQWKLILLPAVSLGLIMTPHTMYMLRATILEEMDSEYAAYARLNGMGEWRILLCHALPNAIAPAAQVMALGLAYLVGGVVSVEIVFGFPGLGSTLVEAVRTRDLAMVQAVTLFSTASFLLFTFIADLIGVVSNPKVRAGS
ncbi:MAG: ABC transporter permease [Rhizobiaceae bacterium]|nr:ABC transporter permease [Rhizobiaceae bacterium]